jgi:FkbM family methyltransferase
MPAAQTPGTLTTVYQFKGVPDGANPSAGLIADRHGVLYGTTVNGATINNSEIMGTSGCGTVFSIAPPAAPGVPVETVPAAWSRGISQETTSHLRDTLFRTARPSVVLPGVSYNSARPPMLRLIRYIDRAPEILTARRETAAWPELTLRYLAFGRQTYPFTIRLRDGCIVRVHCAEELRVFWQIFIRDCYKIPSNSGIIVDAGANVGIFALWAVRQAPTARILSLEPSPDTFRRLEDNIRQNHLEHRIRTLQLGLAGVSGDRLLRIAPEDSPRQSMLLEGMPAGSSAVVAIHCITLAQLLDEQGLGRIDLLKMDIEGSEWEVLLGTPPAVLQRIQRIRLEYHEVHAKFGYTPELLFAHLAVAGHRLTYQREDACGTGLAFFELP